MLFRSFLTIVVMQPVAADMYQQGWEPLEAGQLTSQQAFERASTPLRTFLVRFARERDIKLFVEVCKRPAPRTPADVELQVLIPAYILSELKAGFQIGAVLFLPFLVIDLVVANVLLGLGMQTLNPNQISLPFKLLLFVAADGWGLLAESLVTGYTS